MNFKCYQKGHVYNSTHIILRYWNLKSQLKPIEPSKYLDYDRSINRAEFSLGKLTVQSQSTIDEGVPSKAAHLLSILKQQQYATPLWNIHCTYNEIIRSPQRDLDFKVSSMGWHGRTKRIKLRSYSTYRSAICTYWKMRPFREI